MVFPKTDYGYNYAMDQGRLAMEKAMPGTKTVFFENVPENAEVERAMERLQANAFVASDRATMAQSLAGTKSRNKGEP